MPKPCSAGEIHEQEQFIGIYATSIEIRVLNFGDLFSGMTGNKIADLEDTHIDRCRHTVETRRFEYAFKGESTALVLYYLLLKTMVPLPLFESSFERFQ